MYLVLDMLEYFSDIMTLFGKVLSCCIEVDYFKLFFGIALFLLVLSFILRLSRFLGGG